MGKTVLMLAGDFVEDYEVMVPYQALLSVGVKVDVVCPGKRKGEVIATAVHDFVGFQTYAETRGHNFVINKTFEDVKLEDYDGLYVCGGRAPEYIRLNKRVIEIVQSFFEKKLPVAAICHGIQVLTPANVLQGRTLTAYPAIGPDITVAGGIYKEVDADKAVVDDNLVTSPAWPGHPAILKEFYRILGITIA
ncbi:DJ-1/PfpI family protein [Myroides indicus]|jgi:protease I|uniref:Protease I n=1 Tax=Myroides indicus TaxID=1323422 RepID=A0A4R7EWI5_9FLAO|nr:DJ-1/PfpI family protein [Myroides indicus]TDS58859.1 protease I [Myroides indicus]